MRTHPMSGPRGPGRGPGGKSTPPMSRSRAQRAPPGRPPVYNPQHVVATSDMPLQAVVQALSITPQSESQARAVLAYVAARYYLADGNDADAVRSLGTALEAMPNLRPAMRLLYRIYAGAEDVRSAVMYLDQEIRATRHPREAAALYRERGQLVERNFNDLSAALQCHQAALKATPRDLAVLRSVERVQLARGDVFGLIEVLESQLEVLKDDDTAAAVLQDLARLETRVGGELDLAADMLAAALELKSDHPGIIADLFRVSETANDGEMMLLALEHEAERREGVAKAMPLARASLVLREQKERPAAVALLHAAARAHPQNLSLWRSLEELAMASSRYEVAAMACIGALWAIEEEDRDARAGLYYRLGRLAMIRLDQVNEGLAAMRKCLRIFPQHIVALEDTARYLIANQMWAQLLELLTLQISTEEQAGLTRSERALARLRAGQVLEERLGELDGARRLYEEAATIAPDYRPVHDRLERVLHQLDDRGGLVDYYRAEYERAASPERKSYLLGVLGQLASALERPEEAIKYLGMLLKEQPKHVPSLQRFARLLSHAGRTTDVLRVTEQEIRLTDSPSRKAKLLHRAGELAIELEDPERARSFFEQALDAIDDHAPTIEALDRLLRKAKDHPARLELLRTQLLYSNDRERRASLRLEIAGLLANELERPEEALAELDALLQRAPKDLAALHAAEQLATRLERWPMLAELLERHAAAVEGPQTRALLLHRCATVRMGKLDDPSGAIRNLVRALELWPQLGVARALLLRLYEAQGLSRELQSFAESGLQSERGSDDRRAMALQLAELSPRPVVALQYLSAVAEVRPDDFVTQLRLARAARSANRPSRAAGAYLRAVDHLRSQGSKDARELFALSFRAARAEEAAGNLDRADDIYARLLDDEPNNALAKAGRLRIKKRKSHIADAGADDALAEAQGASDSDAGRAAYATIRAELAERRGELEGALTLADDALINQPDFVPALHVRARVLERLGGAERLGSGIDTLYRLAEALVTPAHKVRALCQAGRLALRTGTPGEPNPTAWQAFERALRQDPSSEDAFRGLIRTQNVHGDKSAPDLGPALNARLEWAKDNDQLDRRLARAVGRLALANGPELAIELLRSAVQQLPMDAGLRTDLAHALAQVNRWDEVVGALEGALANELSPERAAALHYFAGDAHARANSPLPAIDHFLAAARAGYHAEHALRRSDELAAQVSDLERRVESLQLLVELSPPHKRIDALRTLATLYREELGQADDAVELLREVARIRPTHLEPVQELHGLLLDLDRHEEAKAAVLSSIAHHRAWIRAHGVKGLGEGNIAEPEVLPVIQLRRLFGMIGDADGIFLCTAILETTAPRRLQGAGCDDMLDDPFPLPARRDGHALELLIGDLHGAAALALLQAGARLSMRIPGDEAASDLDSTNALPQSAAVVTVVHALAAALGVPPPLVFLDPDPVHQYGVQALQGAAPALLVGRRVNAGPSTPRAREVIGRALMRLAHGGDVLAKRMPPKRQAGVLLGLCHAAQLDTERLTKTTLEGASEEVAAFVAASVRPDDELLRAAQRFVRTTEVDAKTLIGPGLALAEDRAAVICAADPRSSLEVIRDEGALMYARGTALLGYLIGDDHLSLRRALGYDRGLLLDLEDIA